MNEEFGQNKPEVIEDPGVKLLRNIAMEEMMIEQLRKEPQTAKIKEHLAQSKLRIEKYKYQIQNLESNHEK